MKKSFTFTLPLVALALCACNLSANNIRGSGNVVQEERQVSGIRGVALTTIGDMTISLGESETLTIEAEDNLLPYLESELRSGILTISSRSNTNLQPTKPLRYHLTVTSLEALSVTSTGNIDAPALQAGSFTAHTSSNGSIHLAGLTAGSLQAEINSDGDIIIDAGQVTSQDVTISSSGEYRAEDLQSQSASVEISSSGDATIWVTNSLTADLSSSGSINYYGRPEITQSMSSSGKLVPLGDK